MKLIYRIALDGIECLFHCVGGALSLDMGFKLGCVIMDEKMRFHLWKGHDGHLVLGGSVDDVPVCCYTTW